MNIFEKKLGKGFLDTLPNLPGVYRVLDHQSKVIYIGKAKNLKRRLGQYKNAKRRKKHKKMRKIIENATSIEFEVASSEAEAELKETKLIQELRPKWNVVGAFCFLYPMVGLKSENRELSLCYTTDPSVWEEFQFHGAFRSREITKEAFFGLVELLRYIGHCSSKAKRSSSKRPKYSSVYTFRQISEELVFHLEKFLKGESKVFLESLVFELLENAGARNKSAEVQETLKKIIRFWKHEALPLYQAREISPGCGYPIHQEERDLLFIKYRYSLKNRKSINPTLTSNSKK